MFVRCRGSSPLTRGKRTRRPRPRVARGLIPAHAGKTLACSCNRRSSQAHPRSRGENLCGAPLWAVGLGSSPLTRGKLSGLLRGGFAVGLIPAHAGKTPTREPRTSEPEAHPRSRGENGEKWDTATPTGGSSPLTRGKLLKRREGQIEQRLIPAHAGKTPRIARKPSKRWAHPRSRGENQVHLVGSGAYRGSSPLTRGKPC